MNASALSWLDFSQSNLKSLFLFIFDLVISSGQIRAFDLKIMMNPAAWPTSTEQFAFYRNTLAMKNQINLFYWVFVSMCCLPLAFGIVEKDLSAKKNLCSIKRILARATRKVRACDWVQSISVRATILEVLETSLLHDRFLIAILAVGPDASCHKWGELLVLLNICS